MNKIYSLLVFWLCHAVLYAQLGGVDGSFDPSNPPNPDVPETKYTLTTTASPSSVAYANAGGRYYAGTEVYVSSYSNSGYSFVRWTDGDEVVSTSQSFYYTMPNRNVTLKAEYKFDPTSPGNPDAAGVSYLLTLKAQPANGGSFNISQGQRITENTETYLYAYTNTGYEFVEWQADGETLSTEQRLYYTMPSQNTTLTAVFKYNPANPGNPGANSWIPETGELIVDDFTTGSLYSTVYNLTNGNNDAVTQIIVIGKINYNDFSIAGNCSNCTLLDLSRTSGLNYVPSYSYYNNNVLNSIVLPASIENIEDYAFYQCGTLAEISCYAPAPPTVGYNAFYGLQDGLIVRVPAASLSLYQDADGWRNFTILPLAEEVSALEVNLPAGSEDGRYKNMYIELINVNSGQKMRYVVSDRVVYTFNSLMRNSQWNVYLKNGQDVVLGQIDDIDIQGSDVSVTFTDVKVPRNLTLTVMTPTGIDVTAQTSIRWMDAKDTYLTQGNSISGVIDGTELKYRVMLPQTLATAYIIPSETVFTVDSQTDLSVTLQNLPTTVVTGVITNVTTGLPIAGANVSILQTVNGSYSKSQNVRTDLNGQFNAMVFSSEYASGLTLTCSATDYISQTLTQDMLTQTDDAYTAEVALKSITGATISLNFTYTASVAAGTEAEKQGWYSDYANVSYNIYNVTKQKEITSFNVQYPQIVLLEEVNEGDELRLTATSRASAFVPVVATATIDELNRASATFDIKQLGQLSATFGTSSNSEIMGILYDGKGKLLSSKTYSNASVSFTELQDGNYTLVTMAKSNLFNSIYDLSQFSVTGLRKNVDYVQNSVTVASGVIAVVNNSTVPYLDEAKLYYTGDNTSFTVNKTQVTAGQYLTLNSHIDFKSVYAQNVSDVKLIVDLPEESSFVDGSVMVGSSTSSYVTEDNRITIPLTNYSDRIRFCFIPTAGGTYSPNAFVQFTVGGKEVTQPIGSATYTAKDLSISVPSLVATTSVPVSGTAIGKSKVEIYDSGSLLDQTVALANGTFTATVELESPYNLSSHDIYARIITPAGVEMQTESQTLTYDANAIQVSKVKMYHNNPEVGRVYELTFDFLNPSTKEENYIYYIYNKVFTFTIDFTVNDPEKISNVVLYVKTADDNWHPLNATFDRKKECWVASGEFGNYYDGILPVNVSVDFKFESEVVLDANQLSNEFGAFGKVQNAMKENSDSFESLEQRYAAAQANGNDELMDDITEQIMQRVAVVETPDEPMDADSFNALLKEAEEANESLDNVYNNIKSASIYNSEVLAEYMKGVTINTTDGLTEEELIAEGFERFEKTDGTAIYVMSDESGTKFVDFSSNLYIVMSNNATANVKSMLMANGDGWLERIKNMSEKIRSMVSDIMGLLDSCVENLYKANAKNQKVYEEYVSKYADARINGASRAEIEDLQKQMQKYAKRIEQNKDVANWLERNVKQYMSGSTATSKIAGKVFSFSALVLDGAEAVEKLSQLYDLRDGIESPCTEADASTTSLKSDVSGWITKAGIFYTFQLGSDLAELFGMNAGLAALIPSGGTSVTAIAAAVTVLVANIAASVVFDKKYTHAYNQFCERNKNLYLLCNKKPCGDKPCPGDNDGNGHGTESGNTNKKFAIDPSGFVYEGVASNRLQGVTATIYYKEEVEDMYGSIEENIVLWDAEEYAQENPLFTDEYGMYQWDVPTGLWQVKFEKEGYVTTYSEWLPVPPPQLDVNVAMVQDRQPDVLAARAYEDGVEVDFDKYMLPETLTTENIKVTKNGSLIDGSIEFLNEEEASADDATTYVSRIKFVPADDVKLLSTDEVSITVSKVVKSYAGLQMQEDYTQTFDVEKAVRSIVVDEVVNVVYDGDAREVLISAQPYDAAVGKTLKVKTASKMIADITAGNTASDENGEIEVVLNDDGQATISLTGELPGSTVLLYTMENVNVSAQTTVNVSTEALSDTEAPVASRASGSSLYRGTQITLTCPTRDAVIYYTLDGTCPCNEETRLTYDGSPIVVDADITIKAMAQATGLAESEVVEFSYTIKQTVVGLDLKDGWTWVSHNLAATQNASETFDAAMEVKSQTEGLIKDDVFGLVGNLTDLLPVEGYKVRSASDKYVELEGEEFNARDNSVNLHLGWNWIGYPVSQSMTIDEALANYDANVNDRIVGQSGFAEYDDEDDMWIGSLETMVPGQGYMYYSAANGSIWYNTSIVSKAKSLYGHRTVSQYIAPWAVNIYQYPDVMPITADLYNGESKAEADEFSIGAFCGTECRGLGKYVKGVLFLSVCGEGNENITFLAADNNTEDIYHITEVVPFTADALGSYKAPYALHIGDKATGIAELNAKLSVSPAVAQTTITVAVPGDRIERLNIINTGGVPVISVNSVDSPVQINVASLPEGAYIVAVKSEGQTYYKKVIKVNK